MTAPMPDLESLDSLDSLAEEVKRLAHDYGTARFLKDWGAIDQSSRALHAAIDRLRDAAAQRAEWRAMLDAPLDGTEVELLLRHPNWWTAHKHGAGERWEGIVRAKWIDFNGGGWSWHGMSGTPVGWRGIGTQEGE